MNVKLMKMFVAMVNVKTLLVPSIVFATTVIRSKKNSKMGVPTMTNAPSTFTIAILWPLVTIPTVPTIVFVTKVRKILS